MNPDHDILLVLDGELAYVGVDDAGGFCVERKGCVSKHDTFAEALVAAAKAIGAVP